MVRSFRSNIRELPAPVRTHMQGRSWHAVPECPRFEALRLIELVHHDFHGGLSQGELVVHEQVAEQAVAIFERLFNASFAIESMLRIDVFEGSDDASMAANNSSAFNFRRVQGTTLLSHHALGVAIDLNPVQNPWVRGERVDPEAGRAFLARDRTLPGMITADGPVVEAFRAHGWYWGGDFPDAKDYHHFSKLPR